MKAYTDLEQSRKLAEILPLESADMYYMETSCNNYTIGVLQRLEKDMLLNKAEYYKIFPCWSLAALLDILAKQGFIIKSVERNNEYQYNIDIPSRHCKIWFSSLLDAAFEMVCWLKENRKI